MRKTYGKNTRRTIKDTFGRFAAIFAIVALGVAFLAGLLSSVPDMRLSFDKYFDSTKLYDIRVLGDLGFTDADVSALKKLDGVSDVQAGYTADVLMSASQGNDFSTRLHSYSPNNTMNLPQLTSGRFPQKSNECVIINVPLGSKAKFRLEDILTASDKNKNLDDTLKTTKFTVVGFADDSRYFSAEKEYTNIGSGTIDLFLLVPDASFNTDVYTDMYITANGAFAETCMTDKYKALTDGTADEVKTISSERGKIRHDEVLNESSDKINDARADLAKAKSDADTKLSDAAAKISDGKKQIVSGENELLNALKKLQDSESELDRNEADLNKQEIDASSAFADADKKIIDSQNELDTNLRTANTEMTKAVGEMNSYKLLPLQQTAFNVIRALPIKYPSLPDHLNTLQKDNDRLSEIAELLNTISKMSPGDQVKSASEINELMREKNTLTLEIQKIMGNEDYNAYISSVMRLAATSPQAESLAPIALKLGSLDSALAQIKAGQSQLDSQRADLQIKKTDAAKKFADGRDKIADGREKLQIAKADWKRENDKIDSARAKLNASDRNYDDAKVKADKEISDGEQKISDNEAKLSNLDIPSWHIFTRDDNVSYNSLKANIDKVGAIAKVFPFFFFLVAALVASTTMTRMIEDERLQIGTMKSLGYSRGAIMGKYILYALTASILGSVFGVAIGYRLFPSVIWNAYKMMYELPTFYSPILWVYALTTSGAVIICVLLATLGSCRATLHEKPATLMLNKAPQPGKRVLLERVTFIWRRMKFTHKVTARNIFRYKKRFFMTIIGVAGCTALLVTGFGMRDSFSTITDVQYGEIFTYNVLAPINVDNMKNSSELSGLLGNKDLVYGSTSVNMENVTATHGGKSISISTFIPKKAEDLQGFVNLRNRSSGKALRFGEGSVIISERASELLGIRVGDDISISDKDGKTSSFVVSGICENYVRNYIYMSEGTYSLAMGREAEANTLLISLRDSSAASQQSFGTKLLATNAVGGVSFNSDAKEAVERAIGRINMIVAVIIMSAGALALVVLYNLTNINISERIKEIATIKVLGFTDHEVYGYVNRESVLLSIMGTLLGLVLGIFLHRYVMGMAEMDVIMFGRSIKAISFVYSAVLTMVFSVFVDLVLRRKLRKISMVESMKAPE